MKIDSRKSPAPKNLGARGLKFWRDITAQYVLRPDELRLLEDACRTMSLIDKLEQGVAENPLYLTGSQGQQVINPAISELRQQRNSLKSILAALNIPDEEAAVSGVEARSVQARDAAKSRWTVHHGKAS